MNLDLNFYHGKKVFVTGHTGFKGSWLCRILANAGAEVTGYSLSPPTEPSLFEIASIKQDIHSVIGDIRDYDSLKAAFSTALPEIVIHLAAQPIVRDSYKAPAYTYETNVMGTVNILECVRNSDCVRSFLNVTTDKVYLNKEWVWGYREDEELGGYDPYSNSKSCSELVTHSYKKSFFENSHTSISTARAGNVIGGGDFANDRIIPDCIRAAVDNRVIIVRNPLSIRPYQHVLEPLYVYLMIAAMQYDNPKYAGCYNVGPDEGDCIQTGALVELFANKWGDGIKWVTHYDGGPHEANFLKLDCSRLKTVFGWKPHWKLETAMEMVVEWIQYGAVPVFVDVTVPQYNIDVTRLEEALSPKTKAVMIAHTLGNPFDLSSVRAFCNTHKLWLVEDNCDALGTLYTIDGETRFTGTWGDIGTSSFYPPHHMTMGEGGCVYTNNPMLNRLILSFRDWGRDCICPPGLDNFCGHRFDGCFGELPKGYDHKYVYSHFGYNLKVTDMQAAIGCEQLRKFPSFVERRRHNWERLRAALEPAADRLILPEPAADSLPSWFGFLISVHPGSGLDRNAITCYLEKHNIQTRLLFGGNLIRHPCFDQIRGTDLYRVAGELTSTDFIMNNTFWVGVYPGMTDEMIDYMAKIIMESIL